MSEDESELSERLQQLEEAVGQANLQCHRRTAARLAREGMRLSKRMKKLTHYLWFCDTYVSSTDYPNVDVSEVTDVIVECIALLEDDNKAKEFEPGIEEGLHEYNRWRYLPSLYHALASMTGQQEGDNSPGLHQCVQEGIAVCRYLGSSKEKLLMFREFVVDVLKSSDDLEMALHKARECFSVNTESSRKVASADDIASILALQGNLRESCDMIVEGFGLCQQFHNPYLAMLNFVPMAREIACMAGRADILEMLPIQLGAKESTELPEEAVLRTPDHEENFYFEYMKQRCRAIELACSGKLDDSLAIVEYWDKFFYEKKSLRRWFHMRCRLIALERLKGNMERVRALAKPAEVLAKRAHDWLTLRKLRRLLDPNIPANPFVTLGDCDCGPFGSNTTSVYKDESSDDMATTMNVAESGDVGGASKPSPNQEQDVMSEPLLPEYIEAMYAELEGSGGDESTVNGVAQKALSIPASQMRNTMEAEHLLRLAGFLTDREAVDKCIAWGREVMQQFPSSADIVSMVAAFWAQLQTLVEDSPPESISDEVLVTMFQRAMDMEVDSAKPFYRAGAFHFGRQNLSEAERCLARAFRLDRLHGTAARTLAKVYNYTDRPRDAMTVLDMCLREGSDDPNVAWEAAIQANSVEQFESVLTYLARLESLVERQPWCDYYRALALQELGRPAEALEALEREEQLNPESTFGVLLQRASVLAMLGDIASMSELLGVIVDTPLASVETLTRVGFSQLCNRLWRSVSAALPAENEMRQKLEQKLLDSCLAPDEMFEALRTENTDATEETVRYFQVYLKQSLDESWASSSGCLLQESEWKEFIIVWRLLARDDDHAKRIALEWQCKSFREPSIVEFIESGEQEYTDRPGVVGLGPRYAPEPRVEES